MNKVHQVVNYRRKREQKTDYHQRLRLLQSRKPRLVIRLTNTRMIAQVISFEPQGDRLIVGIDSTALAKEGKMKSLKNKEAAYALGKLIAQRAQEQGTTEAILDTGFRRPRRGNRLSVFLKGVVEGGLTVPHAEDIILTGEATSAPHHGNPEISRMPKSELFMHKKTEEQHGKRRT